MLSVSIVTWNDWNLTSWRPTLSILHEDTSELLFIYVSIVSIVSSAATRVTNKWWVLLDDIVVPFLVPTSIVLRRRLFRTVLKPSPSALELPSAGPSPLDSHFPATPLSLATSSDINWGVSLTACAPDGDGGLDGVGVSSLENTITGDTHWVFKWLSIISGECGGTDNDPSLKDTTLVSVGIWETWVCLLLPTTAYYCLLLPTTAYYCLLLPTTAYYCLLLPTTAYYCLLLPTTAYYCLLLPTTAYYCLLLPTTAYYCLLLPTTAYYCLLLPTTAYYCLLLPTTAYYCLLLPTTAYYCLLLPTTAYYCLLLPTTAYYCLLLPTTAYYCLLLPTTAYYCLLLPTTAYYCLLLPTTAYYCLLLPTTAYYCLLLPTTAYYCLLLPTTAYYCLLLPTTAYYCLLLPTTAYYCLLLPITAHYCLPLPTTAHYCPLLPITAYYCLVYNVQSMERLLKCTQCSVQPSSRLPTLARQNLCILKSARTVPQVPVIALLISRQSCNNPPTAPQRSPDIAWIVPSSSFASPGVHDTFSSLHGDHVTLNSMKINMSLARLTSSKSFLREEKC